jgi:hypothetical protein
MRGIRNSYKIFVRRPENEITHAEISILGARGSVIG